MSLARADSASETSADSGGSEDAPEDSPTRRGAREGEDERNDGNDGGLLKTSSDSETSVGSERFVSFHGALPASPRVHELAA